MAERIERDPKWRLLNMTEREILQKEIIQIAQIHLKENSFPHIDYEWILPTDFIELENEIFFEYTLQHKNDLPPDQWEMFGGAPGFCIHKKTGKVRDVDWEEFQNSILKR